MNRFGKGYRPDPPSRRTQKPSRHLLGSAPAIPPSATLESFEAPIMDQGQTGSCTGHGTAQALFTSYAAHGSVLPFVPSPAGIYTVTRVMERDINTTPLRDDGAMPSDVMAGISKWGIRPMGERPPDGRFSDVDPVTVNAEPSVFQLASDALRLETGEYRIDMAESDWWDQVCAAIATNCVVGIGVFVDTAFEDWDPAKGPMTSVNLSDP
ncbi:MAG: hypothetical protein HRJ53_02410, partial [Acidobacteria bacterium Pan2503]|nr:hypothetical protein [Candidatus Acidoferrum panamensis]